MWQSTLSFKSNQGEDSGEGEELSTNTHFVQERGGISPDKHNSFLFQFHNNVPGFN